MMACPVCPTIWNQGDDDDGCMFHLFACLEACLNKFSELFQVHHTATHLLQAALKSVLGEETSQAGSLVSFDRLRFDFNFHRSLQDKELIDIEGLVNRWIGDSTQLQTKIMPLVDAKRSGAIAMFGEKYADEVPLYKELI